MKRSFTAKIISKNLNERDERYCNNDGHVVELLPRAMR